MRWSRRVTWKVLFRSVTWRACCSRWAVDVWSLLRWRRWRSRCDRSLDWCVWRMKSSLWKGKEENDQIFLSRCPVQTWMVVSSSWMMVWCCWIICIRSWCSSISTCFAASCCDLAWMDCCSSWLWWSARMEREERGGGGGVSCVDHFSARDHRSPAMLGEERERENDWWMCTCSGGANLTNRWETCLVLFLQTKENLLFGEIERVSLWLCCTGWEMERVTIECQ